MFASRPQFESLPIGRNDPKASAWGLWGDQDELGTLNILTQDVIKKAAGLVITGETVPLK